LESIEVLAAQLKLQPVTVNDLRERELGIELATDFLASVQSSWLNPTKASPGGESNEAAQKRGLAVVHQVVASHPGGHVVLSTHGNLLTLILNALRPEVGFEFWKDLTFPDVYELTIEGSLLMSMRRLWSQDRDSRAGPS
jgi:2,3-bisphosphoglycerate-dependent phosphoglycerate mutase